MNTRERIQTVLNFGKPDRLPIVEWATWWNQTIQRWEQEGLPKGLSGLDIQRFFGLDILVQQWFTPKTGPLPPPAAFEKPMFESPADYLEYRRRGSIHNVDAIHWPLFDACRAQHDAGDVAYWMTLEGYFWFPRTMLGVENHLYAFYDQPDFLHQLNRQQTDFNLAVLDRVTREHDIEFMTIAEDLSYNHGPMLSKQHFDEFLLPYYRELVPAIQSHGIKVFIDSDGDISSCLDWFIEGGIQGILPLERMAGVDVAQLRREHPDFLFMGGFDKRVMYQGEDAVRAEFARLLPVARTGGFIPSVDHQTPPQVSLEEYRQYLRVFREVAEQI